MDGEKAFQELKTELEGPNFNWDPDQADAEASLARNLPKFPTYSLYYLAVALELRRRLEDIRTEQAVKGRKGTAKKVKSVDDYGPEDYLALIDKIIKGTKRPKAVSKSNAAAEPAEVISYYLALVAISEGRPKKTEEEEEYYPSGEEEILSDED
jgi:hypothetical protein